MFTPSAILQSSENLNPTVTSGPFVLAESAPGDHFTLARNPRYYLASQGLPYLDRVIFRVARDENTITSDLQAGTITSTWGFDLGQLPAYQHLSSYMLVPAPTSATFEALFFDFHNTVLATHLEVRQAIAMAIDQQTLIKQARQGFATPLCTDHPSALHPGYEPGSLSGCPKFDLTAANNLLQAYGWVKGSDGVRANNGQRLEFAYSTTTNLTWRNTTETILQQDFLAIGIKLDIQNYNYRRFFFSFLPEGDASPPTGAVAGRYDIAELSWSYSYDPDDSFLLKCNSVPPTGANVTFFCDPNLDSIYDQELTTVEPGIRQKLFELIHTVYLTNYPFIVLYSPTDLAIARKGTHNYQPSPFEGSTINIWEWWCDHGNC